MNYQNKNIYIESDSKSGFSLIELIVSLTLFVTITALSSASIISVVNASNQARVSGQALNVITFAIEDLVRNARIGTSFHCDNSSNGALDTPADCGFDTGDASGELFAFESKDGDRLNPGDQYVYYWDSANQEFHKSTDSFDSHINMLSDGIKLTNFEVQVEGSDINDTIQPRAKFSFTFTYDYKGTTIPVTYETSVTSRTLDVE